MKIEREMQQSGFWDNRERASAASKELAQLKRETEQQDRIADEMKTLQEIAAMAGGDEKLLQEIESRVRVLEKEVRQTEIQLFFSGKYDKGNAALSIYAGAGGRDAEDWAALLYRMYQRFFENRGWNTKIIHEHWGEGSGPAGWGIKNATILVEVPYAYGYLKKEGGVHRLVRISPFSSQSLRHTSFALVDVMPEIVAPEEVELKPDDLTIDFFRSSGPGGQNVNKRETAVRITHVPTGLQAASQNERSQDQNREMAMGLLRAKLYKLRVEQREQERRGVRSEKVKIEWGNQIRSYVMHPYQMVKDHRTGVETSQIDKVLDGDLGEFIEVEIKA
ncbi:MAG: peptide chain release factor 2 [Candidatus Sungbacteria bacterium]|nr:peptide chain release factor 2 [Candidatus Sungbacteria bacterium]